MRRRSTGRATTSSRSRAARVALSFERGPWRSALTFHYTGGYLRAFTPRTRAVLTRGDHPELCSVKSWSTWDLFIGYTPIPSLELGLAVNNVGNVQAPFDERKTLGAFTAYNSALHSAVGRFFRLTARYSFR